MEFRDDRFVAALCCKVPAPQVESMYVPQWRSTGATIPALTINP
ncbi:Alpha-2-macroglobulin [Cronobacter sakazakii 696]|nr:Alpha-2-macroglobulin [Cronobacter sakazakii 696]